ncbi:phage tail protein [Dyella acidisoli]|uniref:Uncharacterized protein n=1 Tax=Dyella acidisoli TaxID=1867834 RepID=A0ABQ5XSZ2_9GAMM|nr:phage tail protein [Dyella acidisoli]GLQ93454.1 hypothetical protein GCM10007901_24050 [Dyella acidisoli]
MPDTKNLPQTKCAFTFCTKTREYLGELEAYLAPLEGTYPLPNNAVFVEPGADPGLQKARRLTQDGNAWEVVDDFRFIMLWDTSTAHPMPNTLTLGEMPPQGVTHLPPPAYGVQDYKCPAWDAEANAWIAAPDYSRCTLWTKATAQRTSSLLPGVALPDTLTTLQPPMGEHVRAMWNDAAQAWDAVLDYRGFRYWTKDGVLHEIKELGEVPENNFLTEPP